MFMLSARMRVFLPRPTICFRITTGPTLSMTVGPQYLNESTFGNDNKFCFTKRLRCFIV